VRVQVAGDDRSRRKVVVGIAITEYELSGLNAGLIGRRFLRAAFNLRLRDAVVKAEMLFIVGVHVSALRLYDLAQSARLQKASVRLANAVQLVLRACLQHQHDVDFVLVRDGLAVFVQLACADFP
jgi:hypothetical protein